MMDRVISCPGCKTRAYLDAMGLCSACGFDLWGEHEARLLQAQNELLEQQLLIEHLKTQVAGSLEEVGDGP